MQPIVVWLAGIVALIALLVVLGGFQRPVVFLVAVILILALLVSFFLFSRGRRK